jgi:hypothetical protein
MAKSEERRTNAAASPFMEWGDSIFLGESSETRRGVSARRAAKRMRMAVRAMGRLGVVLVWECSW